MQVSLFRALKSANIDDEAAASAVAVVEEHIDMAVGRAVQPLEQKIAALDGQIKSMHTAFEAKLESGLKGMQTSIDGLKWFLILQGTALVGIASYVQLVK